MKTTLQCFNCKQQFLRNDLIEHAAPRAKTYHRYCSKCLKEQLEREKFSEKVCNIFGIKAPGPRIWAERKRIMQQYGYTDQTIIDCLEYVYNVEKARKQSESLCLVNPPTVEKMLKYKKCKEYEENKLASALIESAHVRPIRVQIKENTTNKVVSEWNLDDYFDD